jgi:hypothetical protein
MERAEITAALEVARRRQQALVAGDFETYSLDDDALAEACAQVVALGADVLSRDDVPRLDELIALETQSRKLLEAMMAEASASLSALRKNRTAKGAYAAQERLSVNSV